MNATRAIAATATSRAAWSRRLVTAVRALDDVVAWKLERERVWEGRARRRDRQRRQRRRQRAATWRARVATWRASVRVASRLEAPEPSRGNR